MVNYHGGNVIYVLAHSKQEYDNIIDRHLLGNRVPIWYNDTDPDDVACILRQPVKVFSKRYFPDIVGRQANYCSLMEKPNISSSGYNGILYFGTSTTWSTYTISSTSN